MVEFSFFSSFSVAVNQDLQEETLPYLSECYNAISDEDKAGNVS